VGERLALLGRLPGRRRRPDLGQRHAVHRFQQRAQHRLRVHAQVILTAQRRERWRRLPRQQQPEQAADRAAIGQAQHRADRIGADAFAFHARMGDRLVEDR